MFGRPLWKNESDDIPMLQKLEPLKKETKKRKLGQVDSDVKLNFSDM